MSSCQTGSFRAKQTCNGLLATKHKHKAQSAEYEYSIHTYLVTDLEWSWQLFETEQLLIGPWIFKARAPPSSCPPPSPGLAPSSVAPASRQGHSCLRRSNHRRPPLKHRPPPTDG